jgi:hypothetical protein
MLEPPPDCPRDEPLWWAGQPLDARISTLPYLRLPQTPVGLATITPTARNPSHPVSPVCGNQVHRIVIIVLAILAFLARYIVPAAQWT